MCHKTFGGLESKKNTMKLFFYKSIKVHLNPKYIFCLNKSLHLLETHFAFLNLIFTFLLVIKVMKSSHHLFRDRASKEHGSSPGFTSQTDLHRSKPL